MKKQVRKISIMIVLIMGVFMGLSGCTSALKPANANSVFDRLEIKGKMGLYTFGWDENKPEEFRKVYADEIVFKTWTPGKKKLRGEVKGIQANIDRNNAMIGGLLKGGGACRHNLSEVVFLDLTKNTAKTKTVYTFSLFPKIGVNPIIISGTFNDNWAKSEKGWFIKEREVIYDNLPAALTKR